MKFNLKRKLLVGLGLMLYVPLAQGQDQENPVPLPPVPLQPPDSQQGDLQKEIRELFLAVEKNLMRIDEELADAGAGEVQLKDVPDAGLDDLLRSVQSKGLETKSQIDRILEIAKEMDQGGGGGGSGQEPSEKPGQSGKSPGQQQEENTPQAKRPGEEEGQDKPQPKPGDDPKDGGQEDSQGAENRPGNQPSDGSTGRVQQSLDADKWGFLPERQKATFRNQGRDNLPVQYRQWIDSYYRRLNQDSK